jgi:hypothetical protein
VNNLSHLKSHLVSLYLQEGDPLKRENLSHLTYCLDELILKNNRVSKDEILRDFEVYSDYMLEVKMIYYVLKGLLEKEKI